ncbi:MAG: glucose-1-phosphate adenylyltransferase [Planctomycetaceae bacterium]
MDNLVTFILGGGMGSRLYPLTRYRSKPAVPLAGKYRLIDIPISNCLNSGLNRIYLITQFNSVSLHRHIRQAYTFDRFDGGFVEILAAQQTIVGSDWYQGTADAVRKNLRYLEQYGIEHVLILSGDQLYRMEFRDMLRTHREANADVTIAALPVDGEAARSFGIMRIDENGRVVGFLEKPQTEDDLDLVRSDPSWLDGHGISSRGRDCLASMGIYLFNRDTLVDLLKNSDYQDFGREVFPMSIRARRVQMHPFDGYWEDIGTIRSFYEANLALAGPEPPFDFTAQDAPIYTRPRHLPPTRIRGGTVQRSLVSDGCLIGEGAIIENSVVGVRCRIGNNVTIRNSILMGADYYDRPAPMRGDLESDRPCVAIGDGSLIDGAIVDKNCRIGNSVRIETAPRDDSPDFDGDVIVRDGVIVVQKGAELADGWSLKP